MPGGAPDGDSPRSPHTMADVARRCDVSMITVSRVFNQPEKVRPETREKVLAACRDLDFNHNALASFLARTTPSPIIGFMTSNVGDPIFQALTNIIQQEASASGLDLLLSLSGFDHGRERQHLQRYLQYRVAGVVLYQPTLELARSDLPRSGNYPILTLWDKPAVENCSYIGQEPTLASALAVEHLADLGHRDIALLVGDTVLYRAYMRQQGFLEAMKLRGLPVRPEFLRRIYRNDLAISMAPTVAAGHAAAIALLRQPSRPTALVVSTDDVAMGAVLAARSLGLSVPGDLSVVSMTEMSVAGILDMKLTSVHIPVKEIREPIAAFFRQSKAGVFSSPLRHTLPLTLVPGQSSAALRA